MAQNPYKNIPSVNDVLNHPAIEGTGNLSPKTKTALIRTSITELKEQIQKKPGEAPKNKSGVKSFLVDKLQEKFQELATPFPRPLINGTGVLIHTNFGRAPLSPVDLSQLQKNLSGYSNLEFDIDTGKRGNRDESLARRWRLLTGAEDALVVNNAASALFLILGTLAPEEEVIISRGELVEIGGSFRIPDIIESSGCILKEVGTTNKTRIGDYKKSTSKDTKIYLKVHRSNFLQKGFVEDVSLEELATLKKKTGKILVEDNGSGLLLPKDILDPEGEPHVLTSLKKGVDVITFSGDKLLGGIQAGVILGKKKYIRALRKNPMYRMLRLDKIRMALCAEALNHYLAGVPENIPLWDLFLKPVEDLKKAAHKISLETLKPHPWNKLEWGPTESQLGGGSNPEKSFPSYGLTMASKLLSPSKLKKYFAEAPIPIIGYTQKNSFVLDLRCMFAEDSPALQERLDSLGQHLKTLS